MFKNRGASMRIKKDISKIKKLILFFCATIFYRLRTVLFQYRAVFIRSVTAGFFCFSMSSSAYSVTFQQDNVLRSSSQSLECKCFSKRLFQSPGDRHVYKLKFFVDPIRYTRYKITPKSSFGKRVSISRSQRGQTSRARRRHV